MLIPLVQVQEAIGNALFGQTLDPVPHSVRKLWPRILICLPGLLLAAWILHVRANVRQNDIPQFYAVGHILRAGQIARLYDHEAYRPYVALAGAGSLYYNRPPYYALLTLPFGYMSYSGFLWTVRLGSYALLLLAVWLLPKWFPKVSESRAFLPAYPAFLWSVATGQDTVLLTLLIGYGTHLVLHSDRHRWGGIVMVLGAYKPHLIWPIPIVLAAQRRWGALAGFAGGGLVLALLSFLLVGSNGIQQWMAVLNAPTTDTCVECQSNFRGIWYHYGGTAAVLFVVVAGASFAFCARKRSLEIALAAGLFAGPMLAPHSYLSDYSQASISALLSPYPALAYAALAPWEWFVPGRVTGIPLAIYGVLFVFLLAFWPDLSAAWQRRQYGRPHDSDSTGACKS